MHEVFTEGDYTCTEMPVIIINLSSTIRGLYYE